MQSLIQPLNQGDTPASARGVGSPFSTSPTGGSILAWMPAPLSAAYYLAEWAGAGLTGLASDIMTDYSLVASL